MADTSLQTGTELYNLYDEKTTTIFYIIYKHVNKHRSVNIL